jgi:CubicO group peptidase (beta-lactamase class C family)
MPLRRRTLLASGLAAAATVAGCGPSPAPPSPGPTATGTGPAPTTGGPAGGPFTPGTALRAAADRAPYRDRLVATLRRYLEPTPDNPRHPGYAGAVALVARDGEIVVHEAVGDAVRYAVGPTELPPTRRVAMRLDSIFDVASITKVFTALLVLQQADRGRLDLDAPVADYLPFPGPGKDRVTLAMVLAHTSGLPVGLSLSGLSGPAARRNRILSIPLIRGAVPGRVFRYSGTGLMVLGLLLEEVTGKPLDEVLREGITDPLGLRDTGFRPLDRLPAADRTRLVATDARRIRGLLRGEVHDGIAAAMGGVAGHAGVFSTAGDLAVLGQMVLNGGEYAGRRLLSEAIVRRMLTNANPGLPAVDAERPYRTSTHGLGVELDQPWFMGRLASPLTCGHTGFTGTSIVVDVPRRLVLVLLTNRAHPNWTWADPDPPRRAVADVTTG